MSREMYNYKRTAITTARDLCYSDEVIIQIHNAKTENEISRIMRDAKISTGGIRKMEAFNFRIIKIANGAEIIDSTLSTPYNSLTPLQMMDYINVENSLYFSERQKRWQKVIEPTIIDKVKNFARRIFA